MNEGETEWERGNGGMKERERRQSTIEREGRERVGQSMREKVR